MSLTCPITKKKIIEPVSAPDGLTYEKKELLKYVRRYKKSPITGEPMDDKTLIYMGDIDEEKSKSEDELNNVREELNLLINIKSEYNNLEVFPCDIVANFVYQKRKGKNPNPLFSCILKTNNGTIISSEIRNNIMFSMKNFHFSVFGDTETVYTAKSLKCGKFKINNCGKIISHINSKKKAIIEKWSSYTRESSVKWWLDGITTDEITSPPLRSLLRLKENKKLISGDFSSLTKINNLNEQQKKTFDKKYFKELEVIEGPPGTGKTTVISKILDFTINNCDKFESSSGVIDPINHITIVLSEKNRGVEAVAERLLTENFETTIAFGSDNIGLETAKFLVENKTKIHKEIVKFDEKLKDIQDICSTKIKKIKRFLFNNFSRDILNTFCFNTFSSVQFYVYNMKNGNKKIKTMKVCKDIESLMLEYSEIVSSRSVCFDKIQEEYYKKCKTILVTFGSLHNLSTMFKNTQKTFTIIIDETSTLLSWQGFYLEYFINGLKGKLINLILIGDSKQLPPYWVDQNNPSYERYSFLDLAKKFTDTIQLKIQYRLPLGIMNILNKNFYKEEPLVLGNGNEDKKECVAWMHVSGVDEETNIDEVKYIIRVLSNIPSTESIIIASPYRSQCELLKEKCNFVLPNATIMTLDQCQGHESDYVAVSLVKSVPTKFLSDKRTCVLISRAKKQLIMFGNRQNYLCCKNSALRMVSRYPGNLKYKILK